MELKLFRIDLSAAHMNIVHADLEIIPAVKLEHMGTSGSVHVCFDLDNISSRTIAEIEAIAVEKAKAEL